MVTKYHILNHFGVYKATVKRNFYDNDRGPEYNDVRELLERRTQLYTLDEIRKLAGFLWTAHDECVLANTHEYNALQVHQAAKKVTFGEFVQGRIQEMLDRRNGEIQKQEPHNRTPQVTED